MISFILLVLIRYTGAVSMAEEIVSFVIPYSDSADFDLIISYGQDLKSLKWCPRDRKDLRKFCVNFTQM